MPSYNLTVTMGHITRDPELKYIPSGQALCEFGIAYNRQWKTDTGEKREKVVWIDFTAWGKHAELIAEHCSKGDTIQVTGEIDQDTWDDKTTGAKRSKLFVRVSDILFIKIKKWQDKKEEPRVPAKPPERPFTRKPEPPRDPDLDPSDEESSIPF